MLKKFAQFYKPHKLIFASVLISAILVSIVDLLVPNLTSIIINEAIGKDNVDLFIKISIFMVVIYLIKTALTYYITLQGHMLGVKIEFKMRRNLYDKIMSLPIKFFDNNTVGRLMARITNDLNEISEVAHHGPEELIKMIFLVIGSSILMIRMNVVLALIILILIPIIVVINVYAERKFFKTSMELKLKLADINSQANDAFSGIKQVKSYTNEKFELEKFDKNNDRFFVSKYNFYKVMASFLSMVEGYFGLLNVIAIVCGAYFVLQGNMNVGQLTAFIMYVSLLQQPISKFSNFITEYNKASTGFARYLEVMGLDAQYEKDNALELEDVKGRIEFKNVWFRYDLDGEYTLKDFNLVIEPGQTVALVGESGAGKTTVCNLLNRYYEIEKGQILIDGIDINDYSLSSLRSQIGLVSQDIFIFDGSLYDNISYGDLRKDSNSVKQAAIDAKLEDVIQDQSEGIMSNIGERGSRLSGGQKQRVSLARVFLKNPPVMVLDEATSALDNKTEKEIQAVLEDLSLNRTNIVVAHRLTTIENADKIVVISKDGIEETGKHEELLKNKGVYYDLYNASLRID
ncbi:MAG: ABC transporter ATP-binding protein [Erysipelotrichales bacterium]